MVMAMVVASRSVFLALLSLSFFAGGFGHANHVADGVFRDDVATGATAAHG